MTALVVAVLLLVAFGAVYGVGREDGYWSGWMDGRDDLADQQTHPRDAPRDEHGRWTDASGGKRA